MKVITEERYKDFLSEISQFTPDEILWLADNLSSKFEEIDTLTVSKLRPMVDAPKTGESFLVCFAGSNSLYEGYFDTFGNVWVGDQYYKSDLCIGWEHIPIYKPELAGDCE